MLRNLEKPVDLRRLKHLVALADTRNFGRAATQCHLSQPAFSRSVQAAEDEMGLKLFDRGNLEVTCTDAGSLVVERARKLLFDSRCLERDLSLYRERLIGDIALGVGPYPAATLLPQLLIELRSRFAGINTRVEVNNAKYLAEHLRAEELDFYVADVREIQVADDFSVTSISRQLAGFYVRPKHPLLSVHRPSAASLLPYGLASVRAPEEVRARVGRSMGLAEGTRLPLAVECDDLSLLKTVAMSTDTVLACPDAGARLEVASGQLVRLAVSGLPPVYSEMGIVSLKGRSHSPMAAFAVDFLAGLGARLTTQP
ncbi:MAG: LysR family transcriptional regulator [Rhodoferax sp.]